MSEKLLFGWKMNTVGMYISFLCFYFQFSHTFVREKSLENSEKL